MNILITGGFGFIGSHLTKHYLSQGHTVNVIDNLSTSSCEQAAKLINLEHSHLNFHYFDLSRPNDKFLDNIIQATDLIYHLASPVGVKYIDSCPQRAIRESISINHNLFPLVEKHQKKLVFASTSEVYGETDEALETDSLKIGSPDILRWGYACSKLMSEFLLRSYSFPNVIVRIFNVTGRGQLSEHGMVLPTFIDSLLKGDPLLIYGDGGQYRSFCDIRDAVAILTLLGEGDVHNGEIYNLGNPSNTLTINELATLVLKTANSTLPIHFKPFKDQFSSHSQDIIKRKPNTVKIQQYYQFKYSLRDTIEDMLNERKR